MDGAGFRDLRRAMWAMFRFYEEGRYREALEAARQAAAAAPDEEARTAFWIACLLSRLGELDEAMRTLGEARAHGRWWGKEILLGDPDLAPLHGRTDFQALVAECAEAQRTAQAQAKPESLVLTPPGFSPNSTYPLLIALHGRMGTADELVPHFRSALAHGMILAVPQGTQLAAEGFYTWDDPERAERDVGWAYEGLRQRYPIDPQRVVLAGGSQGAALAMSLAVKGDPIPAQGFIAVIPSTRGSEAWLPHLPRAVQRGVRGWILTGGKDPRSAQVQALHQKMSQVGLPCQLVVVPNLGHEFPDDFPARLSTALAFVLGRGDDAAPRP